MFIEVNCNDGYKRAIGVMQISSIAPSSAGDCALIQLAGQGGFYTAVEPYEAFIERLSECVPGINGHFRAPA